MLVIEDIRKSYGGAFRLRVGSLEIPPGTVTAVLGPNGSGKSTLLGILAGMIPADRGSAGFGGLRIEAPRPAPPAWRRLATLVQQRPYLFRGTVADNVGWGLAVRGVPGPERRRAVGSALERAGLSGFERRPVTALSGGEAQLVAIARALAVAPELLLLDEPAAHADRDAVSLIEGLVLRAAGGGETTVLLATHRLDQAYRLSGGRVVSLVGGEAVEAHPENVFPGETGELRDGLRRIGLRGGAVLEAETPREGRVFVSVNPASIIVSREMIRSSARNRLWGRITAAEVRGANVLLTVEAGVPWAALVTAASARELGLQPGEEAWVSFKTQAIQVF